MNDFSQVLFNLSQAVPYLSLLIQSIAGLAGLIFVSQGLYKFYLHNKRGEAQVGSAFLYIVSGVSLINLALSINVAFDLLYGGTGVSIEHLVAYQPSATTPTQAATIMKVIVMLLQLYGLFFFVNGLAQIRSLQDNRQGSEQSFKGAVYRIFGGAALLNIVLTVNGVAGFFGFGKVF